MAMANVLVSESLCGVMASFLGDATIVAMGVTRAMAEVWLESEIVWKSVCESRWARKVGERRSRGSWKERYREEEREGRRCAISRRELAELTWDVRWWRLGNGESGLWKTAGHLKFTEDGRVLGHPREAGLRWHFKGPHTIAWGSPPHFWAPGTISRTSHWAWHIHSVNVVMRSLHGLDEPFADLLDDMVNQRFILRAAVGSPGAESFVLAVPRPFRNWLLSSGEGTTSSSNDNGNIIDLRRGLRPLPLDIFCPRISSSSRETSTR